METFPVIELAPFLNRDAGCEAECKRAFDLIRDTGVLVIRDPRVSEADNSRFVDMMEQYYAQEDERKRKDARPDLYFQVGVTPDNTEVPRDHAEKISSLADAERPILPKGADPKWRFHWRMGERPAVTEFQELNAEPVIPEGFPQWTETMNMWGERMLTAVTTVARMIAVGAGEPENTFADLMHHGPHLLAPTGSDLARFGEIGTVLAGFHYDLNFLTIHGKSRFPGLYVWLRDGTKVAVRVPDGCLLVQAGKQIEWLTGGVIQAGFHEVVVTEATVAAVERARAEGRPTWRVSSTCFSHIASDQVLQPLGHFAEADPQGKYVPTKAGQQVADELKAIALKNA